MLTIVPSSSVSSSSSSRETLDNSLCGQNSMIASRFDFSRSDISDDGIDTSRKTKSGAARANFGPNGVFQRLPSPMPLNFSAEQVSTSPLNMAPEVLGILGAFAQDTLPTALANGARSDGLVNDLLIAKQNAWQGFSDYLRDHPNSFSGKIFTPLIRQNGNTPNEQIVQKTFLEAEKRINKIINHLFKLKSSSRCRFFPFKD